MGLQPTDLIRGHPRLLPLCVDNEDVAPRDKPWGGDFLLGFGRISLRTWLSADQLRGVNPWDKPGHGGFVLIGANSRRTIAHRIGPDRGLAGQPAGPGPPKISEALVPPKPKEFDST